MKDINTHNIKKFLLIGIIFSFTNFVTISLFKKVDVKNININGAEFISIDDVIENSSLQLPERLIFIKKKLIENELKKNIYLRKISINKQIFPFGLKINIQTRKPVAFADRQENGKKVEGFVDKDGVFIEKKWVPESDKLIFPIKITGWDKDYKKIISLLLINYENNENLEVIKISSKGFVTLEEKFFQKIYLGSQVKELEEKINLIFDIKEQYIKQKKRKKIKNLDLTDLNNPKIKVFIP